MKRSFMIIILLIVILCINDYISINHSNSHEGIYVNVDTQSHVMTDNNGEEPVIVPLEDDSDICWLYAYVVYDDKVYKIIKDQEINEDDKGKELGEVNRYLSSTYNSTTHYSYKNFDSNYLYEGNKIFSTLDKDSDTKIIVEDNVGRYIMAQVVPSVMN